MRHVICALAVLLVATPLYAKDCIDDPTRSGVSRTIAIEPTDGQRFGRLQYSQTAPLRDKEVILTFDDGPISVWTPSILDTLDRHCVKATFFAVGRMALFHAGILKDIARRGHTIATHTWSHQRDIGKIPVEEAKVEIEQGFAAVSRALGQPIAPFFRYPGLNDSTELNAYLSQRGISVWSVDVVSGDTALDLTHERLISDTLNRLRQVGRGIILFHDIKKVTAESIDEIIVRLKMDGYKIVHAVSNRSYIPDVELLAKYDFKQSVAAVAFTGRPLSGQPGRSVLDWSVDYANTEQIHLNAMIPRQDKKQMLANDPQTTQSAPKQLDTVIGRDILLSRRPGASPTSTTINKSQ